MMLCKPTPLAGLFVIEPELFRDSRGFFANIASNEGFERQGLNGAFIRQCAAFNARRGIIRGLHYEAAAGAEEMLVRVTSGAVFDVALDLRPDSPTFCRWFGLELSASNRLSLYIPKGFAHGYQTLADATEVLYHMTGAYVAEASRGVRWNDPVFGIQWPDPQGAELLERDARYEDFIPSCIQSGLNAFRQSF